MNDEKIFVYEANAEMFRLGSTIARLKLKGIDGEFFSAVVHVVYAFQRA